MLMEIPRYDPPHALEADAQSSQDWKSWFVMCFVHPLTSRRFQFCLTLFPEYFAMFPHGTSLLSNTSEMFSFWWKLPPLITLISKSETLIQSTFRGARWEFGTFTQICVFFQMTLHLNDRWHIVLTLQLEGDEAFNSQNELFPLRSPLLGESKFVSFPPLNDMLKFSGYVLVGFKCIVEVCLYTTCT